VGVSGPLTPGSATSTGSCMLPDPAPCSLPPTAAPAAGAGQNIWCHPRTLDTHLSTELRVNRIAEILLPQAMLSDLRADRMVASE